MRSYFFPPLGIFCEIHGLLKGSKNKRVRYRQQLLSYNTSIVMTYHSSPFMNSGTHFLLHEIRNVIFVLWGVEKRSSKPKELNCCLNVNALCQCFILLKNRKRVRIFPLLATRGGNKMRELPFLNGEANMRN